AILCNRIMIHLGWMMLGDRFAAHPIREVAGCVLLKEEFAGNAVRIALHRERPVLQMRQQPRGDAVVELQQIALLPTVIGEKTLFRLVNFRRCPSTSTMASRPLRSSRVEAIGGAVTVSGSAGFSRTTSSGGLSSRKPAKTGPRRIPSRVHSRKRT